MNSDSKQNNASTPRRYRGPEGLGEDAASALEAGARPSGSLGAMEEEAILKLWAEETKCLIHEDEWAKLRLISNTTSEHEVRFRIGDHRAVKKTWPGTFGFVPKLDQENWTAKQALPSEYLYRQALQNEIFGDSIRLEGAMASSGTESFVLIGQPAGGLSLVISQPWLDAIDPAEPHPDEIQIARHLADRGFESLFGTFFGWRNEDYRYVILDAKSDNFISTPQGIMPIDLLITEYAAS